MIQHSERYHGVALRELIVKSPEELRIMRAWTNGRIHSYIVNSNIGLHIKHSAKRVAPWQFTFTSQQADELLQLQRRVDSIWIVLVCGFDGMVSLSDNELLNLHGEEEFGPGWIRVDRDRRSQYRVFGPAGQLNGAKSNGVTEILEDVQTR